MPSAPPCRRGWGVVLLALAVLVGCAADKPKPKPLEPVTPKIAGRQVWSAKLDGVRFPLSVVSRDGSFIVAVDDGTRAGAGGRAAAAELWRANAGAPLSAGVGSDGRFHAVVTMRQQAGHLRRRARSSGARSLNSRVSTAPLVAGERVFVMGVDRAVHAFDALDGKRLWTLQRPGEALTLLHIGVLTAVKDTLIAGQGPRLAGIDPTRGTLRWEVPVGSPRGSNEVERLADLIGPAVRAGQHGCARAPSRPRWAASMPTTAACCGRATPAASTRSAATRN